ncbi:Metallo-dependent phosphatase [Hanseniaspora valbyensis NRRL Y-1626]|uniref:Serine/threonine-protein phosphatase n=1 Tax=Hanseniaspora valbyensis NRRL Y-1626 TaxID=766949 RepID=A0A1B7TFW3_9ASCO|nr:Metallo-dependent phosphatase [Hanseniaspora valbyensis NRRL Y-1626]
MTTDKITEPIVYNKKYVNTNLNQVVQHEDGTFQCQTDFLHPNEIGNKNTSRNIKQSEDMEWEAIENFYLNELLKIVKVKTDGKGNILEEEFIPNDTKDAFEDNLSLNEHIEVRGLGQDFISLMVNEIFRPYGRSSMKVLPSNLAKAIILNASKIFKDEPNLTHLNNENTEQTITVIGDVHGQFKNVKGIFHIFGKVSKDHIYIFNGDFVDRGAHSCEIAFLLYCLKIVYPKYIFINRGNHESLIMSTVYGFKREALRKYNVTVFELFQDSFQCLPLTICVNDDYLIMHGGLMSNPETPLEDILEINRFSEPENVGLFHDLLWTDPTDETDELGPSKRGLGFSFGKSITTKFLEFNKLKKIIRSHELKENGIDYSHDKQLITVFSAPNYCGFHGNKGAVLHIKPGKGEINILNDDENLHFETFI